MYRTALRTRINVLFITAITVPVLMVFFKLVYIAGSNKSAGGGTTLVLVYVGMFKFELLALVLLTLLLGFMCIYVNRAVLTPLYILKESISEIREGSVPARLHELEKTEFGEIADAFKELADSLEGKCNQLEGISMELAEKEMKLKEANIKLDALCGQVQVIMEELREAEDKYRLLESKVPEIACILDNFGTICVVNYICADMLGYDRSDIIGLSIMSIVDLKATPITVEGIIADLRGKDSLDVNLLLYGKDGQRISSEANFSRYVSNGMDAGLQVIIRSAFQRPDSGEKRGRMNRSLSAFYSLSRSLTDTHDLEAISRLIVDEIAKKLDFPVCILALADRGGTNLRVKAYSGRYFDADGENSLRSSHSFLNMEFAERSIISSEKLNEKTIYDHWLISRVNKGRSENECIKELLYVPVGVKNRKLGVLVIGFVSKIMQGDVNLVRSIANSAAVAIDNAIMYGACRNYFVKTVDTLIAAIEAKDRYTKGHSQRVSRYTVRVAEKLKLPKEQIDDIRIAGILHDVGKIGINDNILLKPGKLTRSEYEEIKRHPSISSRILNHIGFSDTAMKAIAYHHERYDGKGYPFGLAGRNIALEAQIIAVADAYDAMTSNRPYRSAMSTEEALKELICNKRTQFNPDVVDALIEIKDSLDEEKRSA